jgi:N-acetylmuramoyl-L-alanine amidase
MKNCRAKQQSFIWIIILLFLLGETVLSLAPAYGANSDYLKQAKDCSRRLYSSKRLMKYRDQWLRCIQAFEEYFDKYPSGRQADEALYATARLYKGLYGYSRQPSDLNESISRFRKVVKGFPKSRFADDAQYQLGEIYRSYTQDLDRAYVEYFKVVMYFPQGDMKPRAEKRLAEMEARMGNRRTPPALPSLPEVETGLDTSFTGGLERVTDIRHWSAQDYTRIVIDVTGQVEYASHLLRRDPSLGKPPRLYIDLKNSTLDSSFSGDITIGDGLLRKVRAGQYKPKVVRVVLDIESIEDHKIFSLSDPFRIVVDVTGESRKKLPSSGEGKPPSLTLAQQLGLGVKKVVIDPGHGGKDPGAVGPSGLMEKDVVLGIAQKLQEKIRARLDLDAILTRSSDKFLPLEERTALANTQKADLFVSIHTNANKNKRVQGISTYILNVATDEEAARLAAFENAVSTKRISDLEKILNDLMLNSKINESSRLADAVQQGLLKGLRSYSEIKDLGVKQAPFYVLIGAQMPSIMVEVSFITNRWEEKRLGSDSYQDAVAEGILAGIQSYIRQIETVPGRG